MQEPKKAILSSFLQWRTKSPELALKLLMDSYGDVLHGLIGRMGLDDQTTQDVLQEGFIKVWKKLGDYDPEKSSLFTWLHIILRNTAIDNLRRNKSRKIQTIDSGVYDSINFSQQDSISDSGLLKQIETLDPKYREIIDLVYFKGYTQQELADAYQMPLGTVKTRVNTALKLLRKILITTVLFYLLIH